MEQGLLIEKVRGLKYHHLRVARLLIEQLQAVQFDPDGCPIDFIAATHDDGYNLHILELEVDEHGRHTGAVIYTAHQRDHHRHIPAFAWAEIVNRYERLPGPFTTGLRRRLGIGWTATQLARTILVYHARWQRIYRLRSYQESVYLLREKLVDAMEGRPEIGDELNEISLEVAPPVALYNYSYQDVNRVLDAWDQHLNDIGVGCLDDMHQQGWFAKNARTIRISLWETCEACSGSGYTRIVRTDLGDYGIHRCYRCGGEGCVRTQHEFFGVLGEPLIVDPY